MLLLLKQKWDKLNTKTFRDSYSNIIFIRIVHPNMKILSVFTHPHIVSSKLWKYQILWKSMATVNSVVIRLSDCMPLWVLWLGSSLGQHWRGFLLPSLTSCTNVCCPLTAVSRLPYSNSIVRQSLRIWSQFRTHFDLQRLPLVSPINRNPIPPPPPPPSSFNDKAFNREQASQTLMISTLIFFQLFSVSTKMYPF